MSSERAYADDSTGTERGPSVFPFSDVEETLVSMQEIVGRKWKPIIVYQLLADGPMGFSSLKEAIENISSKMLSESLEDLESRGLVDRTLLSDRPVRVEYTLTERGRALEPLITEMVHWGTEHDVGATEPPTDAETAESGPAAQLSVEGE